MPSSPSSPPFTISARGARSSWLWVAPGAIAGTIIWFPATLAYGWYVTSVANYTRLYGSFAAGIATLVWLYITSFSVLLGAELNGVLYWERQNQTRRRRPARANLLSSPVEPFRFGSVPLAARARTPWLASAHDAACFALARPAIYNRAQ